MTPEELTGAFAKAGFDSAEKVMLLLQQAAIPVQLTALDAAEAKLAAERESLLQVLEARRQEIQAQRNALKAEQAR